MATTGAVFWNDDPFKDAPDAGRPWFVLNTDAGLFAEEQLIEIYLTV